MNVTSKTRPRPRVPTCENDLGLAVTVMIARTSPDVSEPDVDWPARWWR